MAKTMPAEIKKENNMFYKLGTTFKKLSETKFEGWGIKFSTKDIDWKTIVALALVLITITYIIKG